MQLAIIMNKEPRPLLHDWRGLQIANNYASDYRTLKYHWEGKPNAETYPLKHDWKGLGRANWHSAERRFLPRGCRSCGHGGIGTLSSIHEARSDYFMSGIDPQEMREIMQREDEEANSKGEVLQPIQVVVVDPVDNDLDDSLFYIIRKETRVRSRRAKQVKPSKIPIAVKRKRGSSKRQKMVVKQQSPRLDQLCEWHHESEI